MDWEHRKRDIDIFKAHFGGGKSINDLAYEFKLSTQRIRQIISKIERRLVFMSTQAEKTAKEERLKKLLTSWINDLEEFNRMTQRKWREGVKRLADDMKEQLEKERWKR